jgi:phosphoribosylformimino-5-aminoimidazole carboxamide ribotide isomerase
VEIIPVIDLMGGIVVHARRGDRQNYQPLNSPLCSGSLASDVVAGYLSVHPFKTLYIADLDAITAKGDSGLVIMQLRHQFPALRFWVDNGISSTGACWAWLQQGYGDLVLGSEAQSDVSTLDELTAERAGDRIVLSLDYKDGRFLGPERLQAQPSLWPQRIIAMTLSRVGSDSGPDFDLLNQLRTKAPAKKLFAAGGVRGGEDLIELNRRGISGVLVASALHAGRIGKREIAAICA